MVLLNKFLLVLFLNHLIDATKMQYYARISKKQIDPTTSAKNIMLNLKR